MRRLFRYIKGYEMQTVLAPLFKMLEACFELLVPIVMARIVDEGIKNNDLTFIWHQCALLVPSPIPSWTASVPRPSSHE